MRKRMTSREVGKLTEMGRVDKLYKIVDYVQDQYPKGVESCDTLENLEDYAIALLDWVTLGNSLKKIEKEK